MRSLCVDWASVVDDIEHIYNVQKAMLAVMVLWLTILLLKCKELIPEVREQLETVMKEVTQGRTDLDMYLSVMGSELRKAEDALTQYNTLSTDPAAIALRMKINDLEQASVSWSLSRGMESFISA